MCVKIGTWSMLDEESFGRCVWSASIPNLEICVVPNGVLNTEYLKTSPLLRGLLTTSAGCQKHELLRKVIGWRPT